jgi:hypothetical protein
VAIDAQDPVALRAALLSFASQVGASNQQTRAELVPLLDRLSASGEFDGPSLARALNLLLGTQIATMTGLSLVLAGVAQFLPERRVVVPSENAFLRRGRN